MERSSWFGGVSVHESAVAQPHYGSVFSLLQCWGSTYGPGHDEEEPVEDSFDRFNSYSR
jgi:hypothetical protein